jgi:hypothetical protein
MHPILGSEEVHPYSRELLVPLFSGEVLEASKACPDDIKKQ